MFNKHVTINIGRPTLVFRTPENIAIINLKPNLREFHQKGVDGIAYSEDPDQLLL